MPLQIGPVPLADELLLLAHHELTGRPRLRRAALGRGLAAGLIAELMLTAHVTLQDYTLVAAGSLSPPADVLAHSVLDHLHRELSPLPLPAWLEFLAWDASTNIGGRLARAGHGQHLPQRLLRRERWIQADLTAGRPRAADRRGRHAHRAGARRGSAAPPARRPTRPYLAWALAQLPEPLLIAARGNCSIAHIREDARCRRQLASLRAAQVVGDLARLMISNWL